MSEQQFIAEAGFMRQLLKLSRRYGLKYVTPGRSKHGKVVGLNASGQQVKLTVPNSPSDNARTLKNIERDFRRAGFVDQSKAQRVRTALTTQSKTTELPVTKKVELPTQTSGQQGTFQQFSRTYQPNVQGPRRAPTAPRTGPKRTEVRPQSELATRMGRAYDRELTRTGDDIIKSLTQGRRSAASRRRITRSQLDAMDIPQREKDNLIRQGLVENKFRYAAQLMKKAGIHNYDDLVRTVNTIKRQAADKVIKDIQQSKPLQTGRGRALERRMSAAYDKNKDLTPGLFEERQVILERLIQSVIRSAARQAFKTRALKGTVARSFDRGAKMAVGKSLPANIKLPSRTTGFQTARGSKYTFSRNPDSWGKTQRTAVNDPTHPTKAGVKQKSDWTLFTTPDASMTMRQRFVSGSKEPFYKGLPISPTPKKGRAPFEVWNQYTEKGGRAAIHPGSPITDLQTQGLRNTLPLYGQQRSEILQRVKAALKKKRNRDVLRREIRQGNEASINDLYRRRNNPQNPNTLENELRRR